MFIYLTTGENFVEAVSPALEIHPAYGLVFFACSLMGLFFISSLLIEVFAQAWKKSKEVCVAACALLSLCPSRYSGCAACLWPAVV